ncbi:hypothetical protein HYH02_002122 [Chlamydomonas schloesseri]|uniref:Tetrapyrrole biosynthesis uroporphyrinogen III synthase domain-containing protein n=1 Tax=Chlamydomonas schloesseri TaxID=2026947 RepID=A0A835WUZ1_9CHLO|nr:hypothetical protein HYH02_002122 [Chlamydomonas schloesseri]|eukprot:KAG2453919.1 hypothetical protein HYH02_002122 [Chlamydomonas schloesseri]
MHAQFRQVRCPGPRRSYNDGRSPLAGADELPLLSKRIIVTAPRQYSQKLCAKLINAGARPLVVPGVAITELQGAELEQMRSYLRVLLSEQQQRPSNDIGSSSQQQHQHQHQHLTHIAFTSKNGIFAFIDQLAAVAGGVEAACEWLRRSGLRLCALGADGEVLSGLGLEVHVAPPEASTLGLVRELERRGEAAGARVLCPVPLVTGGLVEPPVVPRFLKALQDAGAAPVRLDAYLTRLGCTPEECGAERAALQSGHVHAVVFSSTAEVTARDCQMHAQGLLQLMGGAEAFRGAVLQHGVTLAAHGPYTAAGAAAVLGLPVPVVSRNFSTFDGVVAALEAHFAGAAGAGR